MDNKYTKKVTLIISSLVFLALSSCNGANPDLANVPDCDKARAIASASSNGSQVVFCDDFDQPEGKLSTVSSDWEGYPD